MWEGLVRLGYSWYVNIPDIEIRVYPIDPR